MAALVFFILALTRPQILNYYDIESRKGIDILVTLDISGSMASIDFKPRNRLEVAKEVKAKGLRSVTGSGHEGAGRMDGWMSG